MYNSKNMDGSNKKVLIVEDDNMLRGIIAEQIGQKYLAVPAEDGEVGLQKVKKNQPDIIILDLLMPKIDGFQFLEELRNMSDPVLSKIPVIVVSNLKDGTSIGNAQKYGIEDYFTKTDISMGILLNRISRVFSQGPLHNIIQ